MEFDPFPQKTASNYKRYEGKDQVDFESEYTSSLDFGYIIF
jgi:hypothetical protein